MTPKINAIIIAAIVIVVIVLIVWKPWVKKEDDAESYRYRYSRYKNGAAARESYNGNDVAEISPIGTSQLDGDIPAHLASVNDPTFMTTPSIVLSTTSRIGENLSYKNVTTDLRGSVPRILGGSGSVFNQNIQLEDTNIDPDTY